MKLTTNLIFLITFFGTLSGELDVDVRISDLQQNALNLSQIENTALLVVEFRRNGEELYTFNLRQERRVYSPNFSVYKQDEKGNLVRIPDEKINKKCFFSGYVRGFTDSMVAMSFCRGITGLFNAAQKRYEVNRVETDTVPSLTKAKLNLVEASNVTYKCGVNTSHPAQARRSRGKRRVVQMDKEFKVIELKMVVSKNLYDRLGSEEEVNKYITVLIMQANWFFHIVSLTLVTKAVEIWTTANEINIDKSEDLWSVFWKFVDNRLDKQEAKNLTGVAEEYDCAVLNLGTESDGLLGFAQMNYVCRFPQNVALVSHSSKNMHEIGVTLVHEIAHLLGLPHVDICEGDGYYIMASTSSSESGTKYVWSQCSIEKLDKKYDNDNYFCLGSEAKLDSVVCGDGIQDGEEECDVGMLPNASLYFSKCCNPETCKLVEGAKCYKGRCCNLQTCMFRPSGTKCRSENGKCDLKDVCNGTSSSCRNKYKRNGYPCMDRGFCFKGKCRTRNGICESRIDPLAEAAPSMCYENGMWIKEFLHLMNCGLDYSGFITCAPMDRRCGKMLCDTRNMDFEIPRHDTFLNPCGSLYEIVHPSHKNSLSYVPDGTFCGNNKFCINRKCVNVTTYMQKEFEMYHDANFSYDDQEVEFVSHSKITSGVSLPKLQSLSCMLLLASLLAFFA